MVRMHRHCQSHHWAYYTNPSLSRSFTLWCLEACRGRWIYSIYEWTNMRIAFSLDGSKMKGRVNERGSPSDMSWTFQKGHKELSFSFAKNRTWYMMPNDGRLRIRKARWMKWMCCTSRQFRFGRGKFFLTKGATKYVWRSRPGICGHGGREEYCSQLAARPPRRSRAQRSRQSVALSVCLSVCLKCTLESRQLLVYICIYNVGEGGKP